MKCIKFIHNSFKSNKIVPQNFIHKRINLEAYIDSTEVLKLIPQKPMASLLAEES
jgi:hypothetical protein